MDTGASATPEPEVRPVKSEWSVRRIDLRSPVSLDAWPLARLELQHPQRGVVSDIASAPNRMSAAFVAAGHIIGLAPRLIHYSARSIGRSLDGDIEIRVELAVELDSRSARGLAVGNDIVHCSVSAWLDAVARLCQIKEADIAGAEEPQIEGAAT